MIPKKLMRSIAMFMGVVVLTSVLTFKVFEARAKADRTFGTFVIQQDASDSALEIHPADRRSTKIYLHVAGNDYGYFFLGGDTHLRGNGQPSSFQGVVKA
ncbi:MAG: hypothetical protein EBE86_007030 [Hormoscilla sp. GUM202]|nr:hypothetical protein [Hormoscilla sp. GUM202]